MWPFTSRRVLGNRWWAIAFVIFVCYQAVDFIGAAPADNADNATTTDIAGSPVTDDQLHSAEDALKSL